MSSFLGDREALMPAAKRKRVRKPAPSPAKPVVPPVSKSTGATRKRPAKSPAKGAPANKKKGKKEESDTSGESSCSSSDDEDEDEESEEEESEEESAPAPVPEPKPAPVVKEEPWNHPDIVMLLERMTTVLPEQDTAKYSTQVERINWGKVAFKSYSAVNCREKWGDVATKVRKYRTLTELVTDAKFMLSRPQVKGKGGKPEKHPDLPKKPMTPFFRFFHEKREEYQKANPEISVTNISKIVSIKFKQLPEKKKQKYKDQYELENEEYKRAMEKFKLAHPELYQNEANTQGKQASHAAADSVNNNNPTAALSTKHSNGPPKATSPMLLYVQERMNEALLKNPKVSRKQCVEEFRIAYNQLSEDLKMPFILMAVKAKEQYDKDMAAYCKTHPEHKPRVIKTFLNKQEVKIKDKREGKPERPPPNGYGLFTMYLLPKLTELPNMERMAEVSRRWKGLSPEEREDFNHEVIEKNMEYKKAYQAYLKNLPPEERNKVIAEDNAKKNGSQKENMPVKAKSATAADRKKQQPVSAMFLFLEEKRDEYKAMYPEIDHQDLTRLLAKEFSNLSDEKKAKYKRMELERKAQIVQDIDDEDDDESIKEVRTKRRKFPGEPKKPPSSGYALFSTEQLSLLTGVPTQQRMGVLSQRWHAMSKEDREDYKTRRNNLAAQYQKDLESFKSRLSLKDCQEWENSQKRKPAAAKAKKKPVKEAVTKASEADSESEDSGSEIEDDDDASDSETRPVPAQNGPTKSAENSQDSDSGSGSDDDSDDSDSGSDSDSD